MGALLAFWPKMRAFLAALSAATLEVVPVTRFSGSARPLVPFMSGPQCMAAAPVQLASAPANEEGRLVLQPLWPESADSIPSLIDDLCQLSAVIHAPRLPAVDDW